MTDVFNVKLYKFDLIRQNGMANDYSLPDLLNNLLLSGKLGNHDFS